LKRFIRSLTTPLGPLTVEMSEIGLRYIGTRKENIDVRWSDPYDNDDDDRLSAVKTYLADYFYGREPGRNDIPLDMTGISDFRKRVYSELMKVGFGEVVTYGELGKRAGYTGSARAVGRAMNMNPYLIIVPCHRVVYSGGRGKYSLGGFGAGPDVKRFLLRFEGHDGKEIEGL